MNSLTLGGNTYLFDFIALLHRPSHMRLKLTTLATSQWLTYENHEQCS